MLKNRVVIALSALMTVAAVATTVIATFRTSSETKPQTNAQAEAANVTPTTRVNPSPTIVPLEAELKRSIAEASPSVASPSVAHPVLRAEPMANAEPATPPEPSLAASAPIAQHTGDESPRLEKNHAPSAASIFWLWLGAGMNYQYFKQTVPTVQGDLLFQNIQGPTLTVNAGLRASEFGIDLTYRDTPGKIESSPDTTVTNGDYHWKELTVLGLYRPIGHALGFRFGVQQHSVPFMNLTAGPSGRVDVQSNSLTMLNLGVDHTHAVAERARIDLEASYQYPVFSGSANGTDFKVDGKYGFSGSLGAVYLIDTNIRAGLFWYGNLHQFHFESRRSSSSTPTTSGEQTLFYSSLEFRIGYEF